MKSPAARHMGVPSIPLTDLYNRAGDYIRARGGEIRFRTSLETFSPEPIASTDSLSGRRREQESFDYLSPGAALRHPRSRSPAKPEAAPLRENLTHFESSPITGIHLWFDRQISDLDHAVLLDRTIQWMFHKSRLLATRGAAATNAEIRPAATSNSSSAPRRSLIDKSRSEIVDLALKEVREFFPAARAANLVKSTVIKEVHATYSPRPGIDAYRPQQPPRGLASFSPATGPPPAGPPPWKAPSAADIWRPKR